MKNFILIAMLSALLFSCQKDYTYNITVEVSHDYGVIIENGTRGDIYVRSSQLLGVSSVTLSAGEKSDVLYSSGPSITFKYFGSGTYHKQQEKTYELKKGEVCSISLAAY